MMSKDKTKNKTKDKSKADELFYAEMTTSKSGSYFFESLIKRSR